MQEQFYIQIIKRIKRFLFLIKFILLDIKNNYPYLSILNILMGLLGASSRLFILGAFVSYFKNLVNNNLINIPLIDVTINPNKLIFIISFGIFSSLLLGTSTLLSYFSQRKIIYLARKYEEFCSKRVLNMMLNQKNKELIIHDDEILYFKRLVKGDAAFAGRTLRLLFQNLSPLFTLICLTLYLLYLNYLITIIFLIFAIYFFILQTKVGFGTASNSRRYESLQPEIMKEYIKNLKYANQLPNDKWDESFIEKHFQKKLIVSYLNTYEGLLSSIENSKLVSGIFLSLVICILPIIIKGFIINPGNLENTIIYITTLQLQLFTLQKVLSSFTAISRFMPQLNRYFKFVENCSPEIKEDFSKDINKIKLEFNFKNNYFQGRKYIYLRKNQITYIFANCEVERLNVQRLCSLIFDESCIESSKVFEYSYIIPAKIIKPRISIKELLYLDQKMEIEKNVKDFNSEVFKKIFQEMSDRFFYKEIDQKYWDNLPENIKFYICLYYSINLENVFLFIDSNHFVNLQNLNLKSLLNKLNDKFIFVINSTKKINIDFDIDIKNILLIKNNQIINADNIEILEKLSKNNFFDIYEKNLIANSIEEDDLLEEF